MLYYSGEKAIHIKKKKYRHCIAALQHLYVAKECLTGFIHPHSFTVITWQTYFENHSPVAFNDTAAHL